jgi:hypothetical protein
MISGFELTTITGFRQLQLPRPAHGQPSFEQLRRLTMAVTKQTFLL